MNEEIPLVVWPAYEGGDLSLTEADLLQHLLVIGATGSGKSCLLHRAMEQLIAHRSNCREEKIGLLIADAKQDDTVGRVRELARRAGRSEDVVVLGPDGDHRLDLLSTLRTLADVDATVQRLLTGSGDLERENAYWEESRCALLDAALVFLVATEEQVRFGLAVEFMRKWFFTGHAGPRLAKVTERLKLATEVERRKLQQALDTASLWKDLDPRTRSNVQSILMNVLRPLLSVSAAQCFESPERPAFDVAQVAEAGKLCIVSVNALNQPALAGLLFKLAKRDFFAAVQRRKGRNHRLAGWIGEEYPLSAGTSSEEAEQLATVRSARSFVLAATQGLINLDQRMGVRARRALMVNFGTIVFMRSREPEVDEFAATQLGTYRPTRWRPPQPLWTMGSLYLLDSPRRLEPERPVCPPGTLGRLAPHQAYLVLADGTRRIQPLWFVPWFEEAQHQPAREHLSSTAVYALEVMARAGFKSQLDLRAFSALAKCCEPIEDRAVLLERAIRFFRSLACRVPQGLEQLPSCWLKGLPGVLWSLKKPHWERLPWMISNVGLEEGTLCLAFAQELRPSLEQASGWDALRVAVNLRLYPSRWRPARLRHLRELRWLNAAAQKPETTEPAPPSPGSA